MGETAETGDAELVRLAREGDPDAFGTLVQRYSRAAYAVALSVTGNREDAEDVAQEAFLTALERLDGCRDPDRFAGWLMTIVRNRSKNMNRRESIRTMDDLPASAADGGPSPDQRADGAILRGQLLGALGGLPPIQREIVLLHDLEGWKHREIAERLELPEGTVRSHLHFARKALRAALTPILDPTAEDG